MYEHFKFNAIYGASPPGHCSTVTALSVKLYCSDKNLNMFFGIMNQNLWLQLIADPQDQKQTTHKGTGITALWRQTASAKVRALAGNMAVNSQLLHSSVHSKFKESVLSYELHTASFRQSSIRQLIWNLARFSWCRPFQTRSK